MRRASVRDHVRVGAGKLGRRRDALRDSGRQVLRPLERVLGARVARDVERAIELHLVVVDHLALVHVVREPVDDPRPRAEQWMWCQGANQYRARGRFVDGLDRLSKGISFPCVLRPGRGLQRLVARVPELRRHALIDRPPAHRPHAGDARAHRRAEVVVVTGREHSTAPVHPLGENLELRVRQRAVILVGGIVGFVPRIVAKEPDLVVVVEVEAGLREPEIEVPRIFEQNRGWAFPLRAIVTAHDVDLEADPPRERIVEQRPDHQAEPEAAIDLAGVDPSVEDEQDAETRRPQPRAGHDTPLAVSVRVLSSRGRAAIHRGVRRASRRFARPACCSRAYRHLTVVTMITDPGSKVTPGRDLRATRRVWDISCVRLGTGS
jgi:hypothetical protein